MPRKGRDAEVLVERPNIMTGIELGAGLGLILIAITEPWLASRMSSRPNLGKRIC
jgi:hypothetical protein